MTTCQKILLASTAIITTIAIATDPALAAGVEGKVAVAVNRAAENVHNRINTLDMAQLVQGFVIVGVAVYTFISARHQATQDRVDAIEQRLLDKQEAHGERITRLEEIVSSLATHRDLNAISTNVAAVSSQMESLIEAQRVMRTHLEASLKPLARMQDMLTQQQLDVTSKRNARRRHQK